jgi:hypothetical protein
MTNEDSDKAKREWVKAKSPTGIMMPAVLIQVVQIAFKYLVLSRGLTGLGLMGIGLAWLVFYPGLGPVIYLTVFQVLFFVAVFGAMGITPPIKVLSALFTTMAIILMIRGLIAIRKQKKAQLTDRVQIPVGEENGRLQKKSQKGQPPR